MIDAYYTSLVLSINTLQCNLISRDKKITKLVETTISSVVDNSDDLRNVHRSRIKKQCDFVFIKSRNDDYTLSVGQKFLYCKLFKLKFKL